MSLRRAVSLFFVRMVGVYGVLLMVWALPGVSEYYARFFCTTGQQVFLALARPSSEWMVGLAPKESERGRFDTELMVASRRTETVGTQPLNAYLLGFSPISIFLSLVVATPVSWTRRLVASVWGVLLLTGVVVFALILTAFLAFSQPNSPLQLFELPSGALSALSFLVETLTKSTITQFALPSVVWVLVTVRVEDLTRMLPEGWDSESGRAHDRSTRSPRRRGSTPVGPDGSSPVGITGSPSLTSGSPSPGSRRKR